MNSLLISSILSMVIDCTQALNTDDLETWKIETCKELQENYKEVRLTVVKVIDHPIDTLTTNNQLVIGKLLAGRLNVDTVERVGAATTQRRYVLSVYAGSDVWTARKTMHKGDSIQQSDLELKTIDVAPFVGLKKFSQKFSGNRKLKKMLKKNGIFFEDYLEEDYLVSKMQEVVLLIASGSIQIQTLCIALEPAMREGDRIKVRVTETGAIVEGTVKVEESIYVEI